MYAATYGWVQNDWSGGADESALATHESSQTGWTKYFSKTDNVGVEDGKLTQLTASVDIWKENTGAEYTDNGTLADVYILNDRIYPKKANGSTCASASECLGKLCSGGICADLWISNACSGIAVYYADSGSQIWKTERTTCRSPQCSGGNLVASNSVDFSLYPARNLCKTIGGRLPTSSELSCIYINRASYGNNFVVSQYWSATQSSDILAYLVDFSNGSIGNVWKTYARNVRCVR